ncbi:threonine-phosphate decarboxylase CobD [Rhizobium sp. SSA_523]|uniref:threonine-phosphate decarboxylase CobD n=1 Tax=Rhizobium sp. SSA_523 TaxID=2952477 RepID=UPI0020913B08|nr:threonine-phosphate decarboxylase CobD [Rhizobium sp. SSA_523]MCO5734520.1 threonine-phosphate decarboxylase CobD [Rhizobium sp. SSA_523]WKC23238.1 threonine-phosphate decarboxylase CobD [Rhizobium sp. SSA_523]
MHKIGHGGNLRQAESLFPAAPRPWIDLSTGINPHAYPFSQPPATAFARLPEPDDLARLRQTAALAYGVSSADHVVAAAGTQILLPLLIEAVFGRTTPHLKQAAILSPTYAEHRQMARLAGFAVRETGNVADLYDADLAILVNPNNPDGRLVSRGDLLALGAHMEAKGGLLVVDEAFMDVVETKGQGPAQSVADRVHGGLAVLRSFGKFYGLAGIRLGFAIAAPAIAARLSAHLGPWTIPGPTLAIGLEALADTGWQHAMRERLQVEAERLNALLAAAGLEVLGGTSLFRYVRHAAARDVFERLGRAGIFVRTFPERPDHLRFGLARPDDWPRLKHALCPENRQA